MTIPNIKLQRVKPPYKPGNCTGCWAQDNSYLCGGSQIMGKNYPSCIDDNYGGDQPYLRYKHWYLVKDLSKNIHVL